MSSTDEHPGSMPTERRPPLLELRNICKYFGNVTALENITTRVEAGKVTCVLGDNGAGKSTFIKILSGVHQPSSGEYTHGRQPGAVHVAPRRPQRGHRHGVPGPGPGAADVGLAQLLPRRRADARSASSCAARS